MQERIKEAVDKALAEQAEAHAKELRKAREAAPNFSLTAAEHKTCLIAAGGNPSDETRDIAQRVILRLERCVLTELEVRQRQEAEAMAATIRRSASERAAKDRAKRKAAAEKRAAANAAKKAAAEAK